MKVSRWKQENAGTAEHKPQHLAAGRSLILCSQDLDNHYKKEKQYLRDDFITQSNRHEYLSHPDINHNYFTFMDPMELIIEW